MFIIDELAMYNCPKGMNKVVLYCIVLYCIVLYCIVLYCIVLYCIVKSFCQAIKVNMSVFLRAYQPSSVFAFRRQTAYSSI